MKKRIMKKQKTIEIRQEAQQAAQAMLKEELWLSILDFLGLKAVSVTIARLNSYFFYLSKEYVKFMSHLYLEVDIRVLLYQDDSSSREIRILRSSLSLERLSLKLLQPNNLASISDTIKYLTGTLQDFSSFPWSESLLVLNLDMEHYNSVLLKRMLGSLLSVKTLNLRFGFPFPHGIDHIYNQFVRQSSPSFQSGLTHLSLSYKNSYSEKNLQDYFYDIDQNPYIETFVLKVPAALSPDFRLNQRLKVLHLAKRFAFSADTSRSFCLFLSHKAVLEEVAVSNTLMISFSDFLGVLEQQNSLKKLSLKKLDFDIAHEDLFLILQSLIQSGLSSFKISSNCLTQRNWYNFLDDKEEKFIEKLDTLVRHNRSLQDLTLRLGINSQNTLQVIEQVIRNSLPRNNLRYFNQIPLRFTN